MLEGGVYHGNKTKKTKIGGNWSAGWVVVTLPVVVRMTSLRERLEQRLEADKRMKSHRCLGEKHSSLRQQPSQALTRSLSVCSNNRKVVAAGGASMRRCGRRGDLGVTMFI